MTLRHEDYFLAAYDAVYFVKLVPTFWRSLLSAGAR